jgi:hypothetical protein
MFVLVTRLHGVISQKTTSFNNTGNSMGSVARRFIIAIVLQCSVRFYDCHSCNCDRGPY